MNAQAKESLFNNYGTSPEAGTVRLERLLPGPIERVWSYLTESDKRGKWFASGPMELKAGGKIEFHFQHSRLSPETGPPPERYKDCDGMVSTGLVTRCEPPRILSFMWEESVDEDFSEVTFELDEQGDQVRMIVTHRRLRTRQEMVSVGSGWDVHIGVLIDHLNNRTPKPFWATHEKLEAEYDKLLADARGVAEA